MNYEPIWIKWFSWNELLKLRLVCKLFKSFADGLFFDVLDIFTAKLTLSDFSIKDLKTEDGTIKIMKANGMFLGWIKYDSWEKIIKLQLNHAREDVFKYMMKMIDIRKTIQELKINGFHQLDFSFVANTDCPHFNSYYPFDYYLFFDHQTINCDDENVTYREVDIPWYIRIYCNSCLPYRIKKLSSLKNDVINSIVFYFYEVEKKRFYKRINPTNDKAFTLVRILPLEPNRYVRGKKPKKIMKLK